MIRVLNDNSELADGDVRAWDENLLRLVLSLSQGKLDYVDDIEQAISVHPTPLVNMVTVRELLGLAAGNLEYLKNLANYEKYKVKYNEEKI